MNNTKSINDLIAVYTELFESDENKRHLALWDRTDEGIRGEMQWNGIPAVHD